MKNNKGITLIALVVTIIVLLILAGVSIAMLTGNNGSAAGTLDEAAKIAVGNILTENLKWPYGTATTTEGVTTYSLDSTAVDAAKTAIQTEITKTNSNITNFTWGNAPASGYNYELSAKVDNNQQTIHIDLSTGAVSK